MEAISYKVVKVNKSVYHRAVKSAEFRRWLAKQGVTFGSQKGSHLKLYFNGRQSVLPIHCKELGKGLVETIKRQLGLKDQE
jgi:mRNA interferase HicA